MLPFGPAHAPLFVDEQGNPMMMPMMGGGGGAAGGMGGLGMPDLGAALQAAMGGALGGALGGGAGMQPLVMGGGAPPRPTLSMRPADYPPVPTLMRQLQLGARAHFRPLAAVYAAELPATPGQAALTDKEISSRLVNLMEGLARESGRPPMMLMGARALHAYEERINNNSKPTAAATTTAATAASEAATGTSSLTSDKRASMDATASSEHEPWLLAPPASSLKGRALSRRFKRLERRPDVMPPRVQPPVTQHFGPSAATSKSNKNDDDAEAEAEDAASDDGEDEQCDHDHDEDEVDDEDEDAEDDDDDDRECSMCCPLAMGPTSDENNELPYLVLCEEIRFALWMLSAAAATITAIRVEGAPLIEVPVDAAEHLREKKLDMYIASQQKKHTAGCAGALKSPTPIPLQWLRPQPGSRIIVDLRMNRPGCSGLVSALPSPLRGRLPEDPMSDGDDDDPLAKGRPCIGQCCKPRIVFEIVASPPFKAKATVKTAAKTAAAGAAAAGSSAAASTDAAVAPASPLIAPVPVLPLMLPSMLTQPAPLQPSSTEGSHSNSPEAANAASDGSSSSALPAASSSLAPLSRSSSLQTAAAAPSVSSPGSTRLSAYSQAYALSKHFSLPMMSCTNMTAVVPPSYPLLYVQEDLSHVFSDAIALLPLPLAYALTRSQVDSPVLSSERTLFELDFMRRILPAYVLAESIDGCIDGAAEPVLASSEAATALASAVSAAALVPACAKCGAPAGLLRCGPCKSPYCSAACQKAHWPQHRHACRRALTVKLRPLKRESFSADTCRALYSLRAHELAAQHQQAMTRPPDYFGRAKPTPVIRDRFVPHAMLHKMIAEADASGDAAALPAVQAVLDDQGRVDAARWQTLSSFDRLRVLRQEALLIVLERFLLPRRLRPTPSWLALQWLYSRAMRHLISAEDSAGLVHDFAVREWAQLRRLKLKDANCLRAIAAPLQSTLPKRPATPVDVKMLTLEQQRESPEEARWRAYQSVKEEAATKQKQADGNSMIDAEQTTATAIMHETVLGSNTSVSQLASLSLASSGSSALTRALSSDSSLLLRIGSCLPLGQFLALTSVTRSTHRWQQQHAEAWSHLYAIARWGHGRIGQAEVSTLLSMHAADSTAAAAAAAASSASSVLPAVSSSPSLVSRQSSTEALMSRMFDSDSESAPQRAADDGPTAEEEDAGRAEKRSRTDTDATRVSLKRKHSDAALSAAVASAVAAVAASAPASSSSSSSSSESVAFSSWSRYLKYRLSHRKALLFSGATGPAAGPDRLFPNSSTDDQVQAKLAPPLTPAQQEEMDLLAASIYCWRSPTTRAPSASAQSARLLDPFTQRTRLPRFLFPLPSLQSNVSALGPVKVHSTADLRIDEQATARGKIKKSSSSGSAAANAAANAASASASAAAPVGTVAHLTDRLLVGSEPFLSVSLYLHQYTPYNPNAAHMAWLMPGESSFSGQIQPEQSQIRSGELSSALRQLGVRDLLEPHLALVLLTIQPPTVATGTLLNRALRSTHPAMVQLVSDPHVQFRQAFSIGETATWWLGHRASHSLNQLDYLRQVAMQPVRPETKADKRRALKRSAEAKERSSSSGGGDDESKSEGKEAAAESDEKAQAPPQSSSECATAVCSSPVKHRGRPSKRADLASPSASSSHTQSAGALDSDGDDSDPSLFGLDCTCEDCLSADTLVLELASMNVLDLSDEERALFFDQLRALFDAQPVRVLVLRGAFLSPEQAATLLRLLAGSKRAAQSIERLIFMLPYPALNIDHCASDDPAAVASRAATARRLQRDSNWRAWQSQELVREKLHARLTKEESALQLVRSDLSRFVPMMAHIVDHLPHDHPAVIRRVDKAAAAGKPSPLSGTSPYTLAPYKSLDGKYTGTASGAYTLMRNQLRKTHAQIKQLRTNIKALRKSLLTAAATQRALDSDDAAGSAAASSAASSIAAAPAVAAALDDDDEEEKANAAEDDDAYLDEDGENADAAQQNAFMNQIGLGAAGLGQAPDAGGIGGIGGGIGGGGMGDAALPPAVNVGGAPAGVGADGAAAAAVPGAPAAAGGAANVNFGYVDFVLGPNGQMQMAMPNGPAVNIGGGGQAGPNAAGGAGAAQAFLQMLFGPGAAAGAAVIGGAVFDAGGHMINANPFMPQMHAQQPQPQEQQEPAAEQAVEQEVDVNATPADEAEPVAVTPEAADSPMVDASTLAPAEPAVSSPSAAALLDAAASSSSTSSSSSFASLSSLVPDATSCALLDCIQTLLSCAPRLRQIRAAHEADVPPTDLLSLNLQLERPDAPDAALPPQTHALFSRATGPQPESVFSFAPAHSLRSAVLAASLLHVPALSALRYFDSLPVASIIANRTTQLRNFDQGIGSMEFDVLIHLLRSNTSITSVDLSMHAAGHHITYLPKGATTDTPSARTVMVHPLLITMQEEDDKGRKQAASGEEDYEAEQLHPHKAAEAAAAAAAAAAATSPPKRGPQYVSAAAMFYASYSQAVGTLFQTALPSPAEIASFGARLSTTQIVNLARMLRENRGLQELIIDDLLEDVQITRLDQELQAANPTQIHCPNISVVTFTSSSLAGSIRTPSLRVSAPPSLRVSRLCDWSARHPAVIAAQRQAKSPEALKDIAMHWITLLSHLPPLYGRQLPAHRIYASTPLPELLWQGSVVDEKRPWSLSHPVTAAFLARLQAPYYAALDATLTHDVTEAGRRVQWPEQLIQLCTEYL